ncbi:MAG: hypothetical protein R3C26_05490 [Calditrichia bacterium]
MFTNLQLIFGLDTFQYSIIDGVGGTDTAQVVVQVHPVNDPPQIFPALPDGISGG